MRWPWDTIGPIGPIGPIGDFWRIWRGDAGIDGNQLTIHVEGGKPLVIDLRNPQPPPPLEGGSSKDNKEPKKRQ